jgi:hypothetical protein
MKSVFFALALSIPLALSLTPRAAEAHSDVSVRFFFGQPFYTYRVGPDYVYRPGWGWHRRGVAIRDKLSCSEARKLAERKGYNIVSTRECKGTTYTFRTRHKGQSRLIYVNSRTGGVWRG